MYGPILSPQSNAHRQHSARSFWKRLRWRLTPDHVDVHGLEEEQVLCEVAEGLPRQADHHSGAHLEAQLVELSKAFHPPVPRVVCRVQLGVEIGVGALYPQQVPMRSGFPQ
jgi:hypothetical protein